jgi:hypothetical protein
MKGLRLTVIVLALSCVFIGGAPATAQNGADATLQELARARAATAKYHTVERAVADGYVAIGLYIPGEGLHYLKASLIDGIFDPEEPEILLYELGPGGRLHLVAVEYLVPLALSADAPEGFTGDLDVWREDTEEFGLWELTAWIWLNNPAGIFEFFNVRVP